MSGSYKHCVNDETGKLLEPGDLCSMLECMSGDVYEAIEEMYGMIWYLADQVAVERNSQAMHDDEDETSASVVEEARKRYKEGLRLSPGLDAED